MCSLLSQIVLLTDWDNVTRRTCVGAFDGADVELSVWVVLTHVLVSCVTYG